MGFFAIAPPLTQAEETRKYDIATSGLEYFIRYFRKRRHARPMAGPEQQNLPKINLWKYWLAMLFPVFRRMAVLSFPPVGSDAGNQGRVLDCSFNLLSAYTIKRYTDLFASLDIPCHITVGEHDEVVDAHILYTVMNWYISPQVESCLTEIPKATHMSAISASAKPLSSWLDKVVERQLEASL
ncbi:hypothetical protein P3339_14130 [Microbulbifer sp. MLAF003]|uniref:hypothetical protein n=1 Tax=Microbulbifer sp. MLAF003 TaxID=3032582 RepID=UPI0024AD62C5|nr:hypothetical protein [Microbulbifer sp. MLAF003]WHI49607.1 hypothetical protein P3339_14130 [Microbulbifer sp. MLAF003]